MIHSGGFAMTNSNDLTAENARLRQQLAEVTEERNILHRAYLKYLALTAPPISQEDVDSAVPSGPWLEEFLNRMVAGDPNAMESVPVPQKG
jgi:hypothetical protein